MAQKRLSMRKIREVLRLKYGLGRSNREIGAILRISHSTLGSYLRRARDAGVSWPLPDGLDDAALEAALYPPPAQSRVSRPEPDWARVHRELVPPRSHSATATASSRRCVPAGFRRSRHLRTSTSASSPPSRGSRSTRCTSSASWSAGRTSSSSARPASAKPHLAISLAITAAESGRRVYYGTLTDLIDSLEEAQAAGRLNQRLKTLTHPALLVVGEIGYLPVSRSGAILFFQLVNRRYEHASTVLTSNQGFECPAEPHDVAGSTDAERGLWPLSGRAISLVPDALSLSASSCDRYLGSVVDPHEATPHTYRSA